MDELFAATRVSLTISITATALCAAVGIPLGGLLAISNFRGKGTVLLVLDMLLAVPTVVAGLFVYYFICRNGIFGNYRLLFTPAAIVIGQFVLALPIMITYTRQSLSALEKEVSETARTLGAGRSAIIATLISEARSGIYAAIAATFGRLIGEVGISMMLGGNIAGFTRTMTTTIALETSKGEFGLSLKLGVILLVVALSVNALLRLLRRGVLREPV